MADEAEKPGEGHNSKNLDFVGAAKLLRGEIATLDNMHKDHGLAEIVHEEPALGAVNKGAQQIGAAMGLVAIIELFACSRGLPEPIGYPPQSWRGTWFSKAERAAIRGKDWKRPAIERARQLGFDPLTGDEAEAVAILDHHLHKRRITPPWRAGALPTELPFL